MALAAIGRAPRTIGCLRAQVRAGRIALWFGATILLLVGALHVVPFLPPGADLADPTQRPYAANLWGEVRVSLLLMACFLPWLAYALLWRSDGRGAWVLGATALAGTALATGLTVAAVGNYAALPASVSGVVSHLHGRTLQLADSRRAYYLVLSDSEMASVSSRLKSGATVQMWVSPSGQVGALEAADGAARGA